MSRRHSLWSLLPVAGIGVSLMGIAMIASASDSVLSTAIGTVVVLVGIVTIAKGSQLRLGPADATPGAPLATQTDGDRASSVPPQPTESWKRDYDQARSSIGVLPTGWPKEPARLIAGDDCLLPSLGELSTSFIRWFEQQDTSQGLWPPFDRWLRDSLCQFLRARRVRCFRVMEKEGRLTAMAEHFEDAFWMGTPPPSLIEHVVSTGRPYIQGAPGNGELIEQLVASWSSEAKAPDRGRVLADAPAWLLPIRKRNHTIGLLVVGELPADFLRDLSVLQAVGHLLELYWSHVDQAERLQTIQRTDRMSGVLNRPDFTQEAEKALHQSMAEGEPVVVAILSTEGIRRLDDKGQWAHRDWAISQIGQALQKKLRSDDLVGRFSDDHFVVVLRRLDISLGTLIVRKLLQAVHAALDDRPHLLRIINLRCAVFEADNEGFQNALGRAFDGLQQAREQQKEIVVVSSRPILMKAGS